ncbi:SRPBCC family protein [Nocardia sp. NPDC050710]|uniref:SRPBCC family protein n=1 Tax=Nocardia sp. NPDC050710 TaxID=3157220 RepID=UPI0033E6A18F
MGTDFVAGSMTLCAPIGVVYDYVIDFDRIPEWVAGVSGSRCDATTPDGLVVQISVGALTHSVSLVIRSREQNRLLTLVSVERYEAEVVIGFEPAGADKCIVTTTVRYPIEDGIAYRPLNKAGKLLATKMLERTGKNLERRISERIG